MPRCVKCEILLGDTGNGVCGRCNPLQQWELRFEDTEEELLHLPGWQQFREWIDTYGGNKIMEHCYKYSAHHADLFQKCGRQVSFALVWETVRNRVQAVRENAKRRGINLREYNGYTMNNIFRSYALRHIEKRRPDWKGLFRKREQGSNKIPQK